MRRFHIEVAMSFLNNQFMTLIPMLRYRDSVARAAERQETRMNNSLDICSLVKGSGGAVQSSNNKKLQNPTRAMVEKR